MDDGRFCSRPAVSCDLFETRPGSMSDGGGGSLTCWVTRLTLEGPPRPPAATSFAAAACELSPPLAHYYHDDTQLCLERRPDGLPPVAEVACQRRQKQRSQTIQWRKRFHDSQRTKAVKEACFRSLCRSDTRPQEPSMLRSTARASAGPSAGEPWDTCVGFRKASRGCTPGGIAPCGPLRRSIVTTLYRRAGMKTLNCCHSRDKAPALPYGMPSGSDLDGCAARALLECCATLPCMQMGDTSLAPHLGCISSAIRHCTMPMRCSVNVLTTCCAAARSETTTVLPCVHPTLRLQMVPCIPRYSQFCSDGNWSLRCKVWGVTQCTGAPSWE